MRNSSSTPWRPAQLAALLAASLVAASCASGPQRALMGAYRLDDGRLVSVRASEGETLRCRFYESGESRRLYPAGELRFVSGPGWASDSPVEVEVRFERGADGQVAGLVWRRVGGAEVAGRRVNSQRAVRFGDGAVTLSGRLDLPAGDGPHPAVVLVHGSGSYAATDFYYNGDFLAAHGVAALTYDKRGTGGSGGASTFDFHRLAEDVVAAIDYLRGRPEIDSRRIGLSGYSQGAWVAPLAASISSEVSFVLVHSGLIASPAEEARVETRELLRRRGVDERSLDELDQLTLAAVAVVANDFRQGWEEFQRLEEQYRNAPWMRQLHGTVVGKMVRYPRWLTRLVGPRAAPRGLPWYYDSMAVLDRLEVPMHWFVAELDRSAPPELTLPMLRRLRADGKPYEVQVFAGVDHGMRRFTVRGGERQHGGYAPGYFVAEVEAARLYSGLTEVALRSDP